MNDCIFCKIVKGEIATEFMEQTEDLVVFKDIHPQAAPHLLIVPKKHVADIKEDDGAIWESVGKMAQKLAEKLKLGNFRLVHNAGNSADVKHMHVHFLGEIGADRRL